MTTQCFQSLQGLALRVTKLDNCCNPVAGACSTVTSESFISVNLTAQIENPDEFVVKLANGKLCLNERGCATLKFYQVVVTVCNADPDMFELLSGVDSVKDYAGNSVGFDVDNDLGGCNTRFALEFWTKVPSNECVAGARQKYLYWLLPCLSNGRLGNFDVVNGPLNFTLTAEGYASSTWAHGPYDVVDQNVGGTAGPLLSALPTDVPLHVQLVTVPPPIEVCGCQALVLHS